MKTNQTPLILEMNRGTYVHGLKNRGRTRVFNVLSESDL